MEAVSWRSYKQTALEIASIEAEWLRELLLDLPVVEKLIPAILMNCDNQTVVTKVNSAKDNAKSIRHVKRCLKTIRKLRNSRVIVVALSMQDPQGSSLVQVLAVGPSLAHMPDRRGEVTSDIDSE
jgi:hypothetical protein